MTRIRNTLNLASCRTRDKDDARETFWVVVAVFGWALAFAAAGAVEGVGWAVGG